MSLFPVAPNSVILDQIREVEAENRLLSLSLEEYRRDLAEIVPGSTEQKIRTKIFQEAAYQLSSRIASLTIFKAKRGIFSSNN